MRGMESRTSCGCPYPGPEVGVPQWPCGDPYRFWGGSGTEGGWFWICLGPGGVGRLPAGWIPLKEGNWGLGFTCDLDIRSVQIVV